MTDAFSAASALIFTDPNIGQDATYRPKAGGSIPLRAVIVDQGDQSQGVLGLQVQAAVMLVDIQASDVAQPVRGDFIDLTRPIASWKVNSFTAAKDGVTWQLSLTK